jgi:hypothetical protein
MGLLGVSRKRAIIRPRVAQVNESWELEIRLSTARQPWHGAPPPPPPPTPEELELEREMEYFVEPEEAFTRDDIE